jgi:hypothetical protein
MNTGAIASEISSMGAGGAVQATPSAGGPSFESHLNSTMAEAGASTTTPSDPATQQGTANPKNKHASPSPASLPKFYPGLAPDVLNSASPSLTLPDTGQDEKSELETSSAGTRWPEGSPGGNTQAGAGRTNDEGGPSGAIARLPIRKISGGDVNVLDGSARSLASSAQAGVQIQDAFESLVTMELAVFSASGSRAAAVRALPSKAVPEVAGAGRVQPANSGARPAAAKPSQETSRNSGRDEQASAGSDPQARSEDTDSPSQVKTAQGAAADNSKNASSQDSSGKPASPGSTQATSTGNPAGSNGSTTASAVQAAATTLPPTLSQAAQAANPASQADTSAQSTAANATPADRVTAAIDTPVNAAAGAINSASLVQSQGKAEMHVAMQTDSLGALQLHAVLDNGQLGASIQVVSHDAHTLLSNDLPALQQVLTDQNLRVDHLAVINSSMTSGAGTGDRRSFHSEEFTRPQGQSVRWPPNPAGPAHDGISPESLVLEHFRGRLSVRA